MNCYEECEKILEERKSEIIRKIINNKNQWGDNPIFEVEHIEGNFKMHYIVSLKEGVIIDPFLREKGQIPEEDYLKIAYKNSEELIII